MTKEELKKGEDIYYVRAVPRCDIFEIVKASVLNITDEYFTAVTKDRTYLFSYNDPNVTLVFSEAEGLLESKKSSYYSTHTKTKEEKVDIHAVDEFSD